MPEVLAIEKQPGPVFLELSEQRRPKFRYPTGAVTSRKTGPLSWPSTLAMGHGPGADHVRPLVWCPEHGCGDDPQRPEDHEQSEVPNHTLLRSHTQKPNRLRPLRGLQIYSETSAAATQHETR